VKSGFGFSLDFDGRAEAVGSFLWICIPEFEMEQNRTLLFFKITYLEEIGTHAQNQLQVRGWIDLC
jgi:hypothetical protein